MANEIWDVACRTLQVSVLGRSFLEPVCDSPCPSSLLWWSQCLWHPVMLQIVMIRAQPSCHLTICTGHVAWAKISLCAMNPLRFLGTVCYRSVILDCPPHSLVTFQNMCQFNFHYSTILSFFWNNFIHKCIREGSLFMLFSAVSWEQ